tara:strand:+ start:355 stop:492 length:138 start_codon:yes stop_codon:yes gene_type:complete
MINTIKRLDYKTIAMNKNGVTKILNKKLSSLGLKSWYVIDEEIYA